MSDNAPEAWPEIVAIVEAEAELTRIQAEYVANLEAAKQRLRAATSNLSTISSNPDRLRAVEYAYHNTSAPRKLLAEAFFGDEKKLWHLRKLISPSTRICERCGKPWPTGNDFDAKRFKCTPCWAATSAENQARWDELDRKAAIREQQRQDRIAELKGQSGLTAEQLEELLDLLSFY